MSKIGSGWAQIGEWFGDICVPLPMALAVIGMLIALAIGVLDWTGGWGVGLGVDTFLCGYEKMLIILILLAVGGTLFTAGPGGEACWIIFSQIGGPQALVLPGQA